jgi:type IV pilus assembly protein PilB
MHGRMAVFEVLEMTPTIEKIVLKNPVESSLWAAARADGMLTMREDAIQKAADKKVPFSEINNLSALMLANDAETTAELQPQQDGKENVIT